MPGGAFIFSQAGLAQRLLGYQSIPPWPLAAIAAWLGALAATYAFHREVFPWLTPRVWLHQVVAAWTLRFTTWFLFFAVVVAMPQRLGWRALALAALFLVAFAISARGGVTWALQKMRLLTPPTDRLLAIVRSVSAQMKVPFRRVWVLKGSAASAFALPYTGHLMFSERLLALHPDEEVAAICSHELGHLSESRIMRAGRLSGLAFFLPLLFIRPVTLTWGPGVTLVLAFVSWLFLYASRRLSHSLEQRADKIAQANESDAGVYARALARLYEENLIPAVMSHRRTHPDLYDRLLAAGVHPDFPRPQKPGMYAPQGIILLILLGCLIGANLAKTPGLRDEPPQPPADALSA